MSTSSTVTVTDATPPCTPEGRLHGLVCLVTGSSAGIGRAIALTFAEEGASVICVDVRADHTHSDVSAEDSHTGPDGYCTPTETHVLIRQKHGKDRCTFLQMDVCELGDVKAAFVHLTSVFGRLDVLVNNAAVFTFEVRLGAKDEAILHDAMQAFDVNLKAVWQMSKVAVDQFTNRQRQRADREWRGKVINIGSIAGGMVGLPGLSMYSATKGGVHTLTSQLAVEQAPNKVYCNAIVPGWTHPTNMTCGLLSNAHFRQSQLDRIPWRRFGRPQEVANLAVFLASDQSTYITGQHFVIDGGMTIS